MAQHRIEVFNNGVSQATYDFDEGNEEYYDTLKLIQLGGFENDVFALYRIEDGVFTVLETVSFNDL